jgi:xylan 1,4-beta-xylosidase
MNSPGTCIVAAIMIIFSCCKSDNSNGYSDNTPPPELNIFFGDPYVLLDNGTYYIYGTGVGSDTGIEVFISDDLTNWRGPAGATSGFALIKDHVFGNRWFWAPEVYKIGDLYYMFFSVEEHMAIAVSNSPLGPFTQEEHTVLTNFKAIDHHLFIDDDGTYYMYFAKFENGLEIWGAEMAEDFSAIKLETMKRLLHQSQDWERSLKHPIGIVNEGPDVIKLDDNRYYMVYSANHYASPDYGLGLAYADHPLGPWTKADENPILQNPEGLVGTGHSMLFTGKDGKLYLSYHAHNNKDNVQPRKAYISPVEFVKLEDNSRYTLKVLTPRIELKYLPLED